MVHVPENSVQDRKQISLTAGLPAGGPLQAAVRAELLQVSGLVGPEGWGYEVVAESILPLTLSLWLAGRTLLHRPTAKGTVFAKRPLVQESCEHQSIHVKNSASFSFLFLNPGLTLSRPT